MSGRRGIATLLGLVVVLAAAAAPASGQSPVLDPIDSQQWVDQGVLTWADYLPVPDGHAEFYHFSVYWSQNQYRTAIILVDYPDQPFLITQAAGDASVREPAARLAAGRPEEVNQWMYEYYAVPNEYNGHRTLHGYWMEDTHGRIGVDVEVFGPYTDARQAVRIWAGHRLQLAGRQPGGLVLPRGPHVQPEHPQRRRRRLAGGHRAAPA